MYREQIEVINIENKRMRGERMEENKTFKISASTVLLFFALIVTIAMVYYICIEKRHYNKEIEKETEISVDDEIQGENIIKVLVEMHINHSGMPGPDGATDWGISRFIANDGFVYEYEYDEYNKKNSYPQEKNIEMLSKELISKAKKTEKKLTDEELKLVKDYIKNVEEGKENIKEVKSSIEAEPQLADYMVFEYFVMYDYISGNQIPIDSERDGGIFYESPSISKLFNIVDKYI